VGRWHFTLGQVGWEEVADYALSWSIEHAMAAHPHEFATRAGLVAQRDAELEGLCRGSRELVPAGIRGRARQHPCLDRPAALARSPLGRGSSDPVRPSALVR
jgi:hypothetical protein